MNSQKNKKYNIRLPLKRVFVAILTVIMVFAYIPYNEVKADTKKVVVWTTGDNIINSGENISKWFNIIGRFYTDKGAQTTNIVNQHLTNRIDANAVTATYQDLTTTPGQVIYWSLYQGGVWYINKPNLNNIEQTMNKFSLIQNRI